eukprot:TRINITY_DN8127_c0_g1_i9.p1 TRINITY_DN8127_c0_g1~~TRINITY_DN8127_c0_g1_i9.p1  ORF type:complete len:316 (-),score=46.33 TRINITY_DN8127_c0_g1_i9:99-1046(-)
MTCGRTKRCRGGHWQARCSVGHRASANDLQVLELTLPLLLPVEPCGPESEQTGHLLPCAAALPRTHGEAHKEPSSSLLASEVRRGRRGRPASCRAFFDATAAVDTAGSPVTDDTAYAVVLTTCSLAAVTAALVVTPACGSWDTIAPSVVALAGGRRGAPVTAFFWSQPVEKPYKRQMPWEVVHKTPPWAPMSSPRDLLRMPKVLTTVMSNAGHAAKHATQMAKLMALFGKHFGSAIVVAGKVIGKAAVLAAKASVKGAKLAAKGLKAGAKVAVKGTVKIAKLTAKFEERPYGHSVLRHSLDLRGVSSRLRTVRSI